MKKESCGSSLVSHLGSAFFHDGLGQQHADGFAPDQAGADHPFGDGDQVAQFKVFAA